MTIGEEMVALVARVNVILRNRELQKKLDSAMKMAESANKAKSDFLANMSHEIRTSMNPIIGMTRLLLKTGLNDKQLDYAWNVEPSAESLLGIVNVYERCQTTLDLHKNLHYGKLYACLPERKFLTNRGGKSFTKDHYEF